MNSTLKRSISGTLFLIIMTGSLILSPVVFALLMMFSVLIMINEYLTISAGDSYKTGKLLAIISGVLLYAIFALTGAQKAESSVFWIMVLPISAIIISTLFERDSKGMLRGEGYAASSFLIISVVTVALPFSLMNTILYGADGTYNPYYLLSLFILLWSADVGAYVFGMAFGQKRGHKLYPEISPKKSWEGFFGGMITTLCAGGILYYTGLFALPLIHVLAISLIVFLFGVLGDLAESLFKRNFGVKDSGNIMPGHGGLLDRFDGALLAFPAAIAYIKIFALI
ncbi:MAG: phosphatidate cytidylyltransferase [Bacteroidales bacterium]